MTSHAVWDILVAHAGANESDRTAFVASWPRCREFRFQGHLGFGGKIWAGRGSDPPHVTCYAEDMTDERRQLVIDLNRRLADERSICDLAPWGVNAWWWAWQQTAPEYPTYLANVAYMRWIKERRAEYRAQRGPALDGDRHGFEFWLAAHIAPFINHGQANE